MEKEKAIAVFDSGVGGISVLARSTLALPKENFIYYADTAHFPYGDNDPKVIKAGVFQAMETFLSMGIKGAVIACNTATSVAIKDLRSTYDLPILGIEPALKPGVEQGAGKRVAVIATALTLKEEKFKKLLYEYGEKGDIVNLPAPGLANLIEAGHYHDEKAKAFLVNLFQNQGHFNIIVLGCTHYLFLLPLIQEMYPDATVIDGGKGVVNHLCHILEERNLFSKRENKGQITVCSSRESVFLPKFQQYFDDILTIVKKMKEEDEPWE